MASGINESGTVHVSVSVTRTLNNNIKTAKSVSSNDYFQSLLTSSNDKQGIKKLSNKVSNLALNASKGDIEIQPKKVEVLVWHKGSGKDVGHTAVRIDNKVYGYYPSDTNGNGFYDESELWSSKGNLHIDNLVDFNKKYSGDTLEVFSLEGSKEKRKELEKYFNGLEKKPGNYNLLVNQCTTTAMRGLRKADYFDILYATAPEALSKKLKLLNKLDLSGVEKVTTIKAENLK
ncbi:MAG: hypothetical protein V3V19_10850 [Cocleimonas sp.]